MQPSTSVTCWGFDVFSRSRDRSALLEESFRLYRKKAKEIFEAQQLNEGGGISPAAALSITSNSSSDAKLSYLKNLMLNYLTADAAMRDHMEGAIGTVLQFTADERNRVKAKKVASDSWF
jgi:GRIP domain